MKNRPEVADNVQQVLTVDKLLDLSLSNAIDRAIAAIEHAEWCWMIHEGQSETERETSKHCLIGPTESARAACHQVANIVEDLTMLARNAEKVWNEKLLSISSDSEGDRSV